MRAKLEALRGRSATDPEAAYTAYGEVADLLLALHRKVRESSGLVRDPDADSFFLQDSAGQELPEAVVAAGRLADLGTLVSRRPAAEQPRGLMELTGLRVVRPGTRRRPRRQPALGRRRLGEHRPRRQRADPAGHLPAFGGGAGRVLRARRRTPAWSTRAS